MASSMLLTADTKDTAATNDEELSSTTIRSCANDPNFAVICAFLQKFANDLGLDLPNFKHLQDWLTKTDEVAPPLRDMQIKLLRKTRKTVHEKSWESALSKFCFTYSAQDAWEIERFGYKNSSIKVKLRILRELLEGQFERNSKFRSKILGQSADSLRSEPIGRDRHGHAYWLTQDNDCNMRIYQEHLDEEIWQVVATSRDEFVNLIERLRGNEVVLPSTDIGVIDEDTSSSNSCQDLGLKVPPPEEMDDSQQDEQKVPKLSIKLINGKSPKEKEIKDVGKGEEELAAEEDERQTKRTQKNNESCDEEFEEIEEEYEDESDNENGKIENNEDNAYKERKTVKPLLISQNKVKNNIPTTKCSSSANRKRPLDEGETISQYPQNRAEFQQSNRLNKLRPSLLDSKRSKKPSKYEEDNGEEEYEDSAGDEVEEEVEEEDIDSAAAEEDENEEKQIEDFDDDEDEDIGDCAVEPEVIHPVLRVQGEGSGKECDSGNIWSCVEYYFEDEDQSIVGNAIEENVLFVQGEGTGNECMIGNEKNDVKSSPNSNINTSEADAKSSEEGDGIKTVAHISPDCHSAIPSKSSVTNETMSSNISPVNSGTNKIPNISDENKETENKNMSNTIQKKIDDCSISNETKEEESNGGDTKKQSLNLEEVIDASLSIDTKEDTGTRDSKNSPEISEENGDKKCSKESEKEIQPDKECETKEQKPEQVNVSKTNVLESLKKELRDSKQKSMETNFSTSDNNKCNLSNAITCNRKRRLDELAFQQGLSSRLLNSESEIDLNSENTEEIVNEQGFDVDEQDIGGKRLKMRQKQNNSEIRKKVEAQKAAANDETTSSSGGEEGSRRRRKIVSPKKHNDTIGCKLELDGKSLKADSLASNTNGQQEKSLLDNNKGNVVSSSIVRQNVPTINSICAVKQKPTLAEIIEKKLKKAQEEDDKSSINFTEEILTKNVFPPPKKNPVTKPLKKNLLTQIRQEESDEDALLSKRNIIDDCKITDSTIETNEILSSTSDNPRVTPERQRKRHSSEEIATNIAHEEPEAKKEVLCQELEMDQSEYNNDQISKKAELPECKQLIDDNLKFKEDHNLEEPLPVAGRRSGRRGTVRIVYAEIAQGKRARGGQKNADKKGEINLQIKKELNIDIVSTCKNKESKINAVKEEDVKETNSGDEPCLESECKEESEKNEEKPTGTAGNKIQHKTDSNMDTKVATKGPRKQRDVDTTNIIEGIDAETPVRQSRRIAQQKIREEAERRKLEEIALRTMKQELKKKKKAEKQIDPTIEPPSEPSSESEASDIETKKKVQKRRCPGKNGSWSSGSEEQEEPDDEEDEEHQHYETDPGSPLFKSDHEFSPESDIEDETQVVPTKRARTARKENAAANEYENEEEEEACQKCNKSDHPEWILLCDKCDKGYHCSCLSPVLFYIPEGDWYCPPCQQVQLINALEGQLNEFDEMVERKKREAEEGKRLAEEEKARQEEETKQYEHIRKNKKKLQTNKNDSSDGSSTQSSDDNDIIKNSDESDCDVNRSVEKYKDGQFSKYKNDKRNRYDRRQKPTRSIRARGHRGGSESDSDTQKGSNSEGVSKSGSSSSTSYSDSDNEPIYKLRKRRQINVSYRLNEYDDLINSALKKEMDEAAGAGNLGRGKDISTIIEADKEEKARQKQLEEDETKTEDPAKTETNTEQDNCTIASKENDTGDEKPINPNETESDDEPITRKSRPKPTLKKKTRKLTTLDISSEDDGSDEDFKGSSIDDDEEEDTSISGTSNSDSSLEIYKRKDKSRRKQRKAARRAFRERRKDRKFIVESEDDDDVQRPKSKKKRKYDSDYTESEADDDDLSELSENIDSADLCDDTTTDESDGGTWCPNKRKKSKKTSATTPAKNSKSSPQKTKKSKKLEYSDDDISESEDDDENDEDESGGGIAGGKQPRSQPLKSNTTTAKTKAKAKGGSSLKTKKKKKSSEEELSFSDSGDSTRRTRGRRYAYIEDFDDESSDGGIKPGVQRPDTPPEEREKFIKRQEEIKRMLAEKNAEGAKLAATPRLTPIKSEGEKDKKSPSKTGGDSLSTVPLSVIRQAKVLDIDYLQRRGENLEDLSNDVGDVDDFDDADLPDDLPEDMDEDAIARMVEEEEDFGTVATRELPPPDDVLRTGAPVKPKSKEAEKITVPTQASSFQITQPQASVTVAPSGLQEPVRKRFPMPTMHPPLLRHQLLVHDVIPATGSQMMQRHTSAPLIQRHSSPLASHLLQSALSAPLTQSLPRSYPPMSSASVNHHSLLNRMAHNLQMQPTVSQIVPPCRTATPVVIKNTERTEPETKPRGRRKKITPLRDTLQKQQTAAAVAAAASASASNTAAGTAIIKAPDTVNSSPPPSVIKVGPLTKGPGQTSVITSLQPLSGRTIPSSVIYPVSEVFYGSTATARIPPSNTQRNRGPPQVPPSLLTSHSAVRPLYGPPPPLKGSITMPNTMTASGNPANVRTPLHNLPPFVGGVPSTARHSASHLNLYGPSIYGNPNFGPRGNLRPSPIHSSEFPTGSRAYSPYGFYPPPPPLTTPPPQTPRAQTSLQQPSSSVIVSNAPSIPSSTSTPSVNPPAATVTHSSESVSKSVMIKQELPTNINPLKPQSPTSSQSSTSKGSQESRKKLTTLEAYTNDRNTTVKSPLPLTTNISTSQTSPGDLRSDHVDDSSPAVATPPLSSDQQSGNEGHASEFSGLVSYFSSQHDDYNT